MRELGKPQPPQDRPSVSVSPSLRFSGPPEAREAGPLEVSPPIAPPALAGNKILVSLSAEAYHADPCATPSLSASIAHMIVSLSPAHARERHPRLGRYQPTEDDASEAKQKGSILHALLLGEEHRVAVVDVESWRTKDARTLRASLLAERKIAVKRSEYAEAIVTANAIAKGLAEAGISLDTSERPDSAAEATLLWVDTVADTGEQVQCRGRTDYLEIFGGGPDEGCAQIIDLKFVASAHPDAVAQSIYRYGYDIQRTAYVRALETIRPELAGRVDFLFLFCEPSPPYAVTPVRLAGDYKAMGEARWDQALASWARCMSSGQWPDYRRTPDRQLYVSPPQWALNRAMEAAYDDKDV